MKSALVISSADNVATALQPLEKGQTIEFNGHGLVVVEAVPRGHKIALVDIAPGAWVVKYGSPIGTATQAIAAGTHVHIHNVSSGRGRGDLAAGVVDADAAARLAEPNT